MCLPISMKIKDRRIMKKGSEKKKFSRTEREKEAFEHFLPEFHS